jgi:serine/threonine-protein kinase RIO1
MEATFKSPKHKLIKFFQESRDSWRDRAKKYYQEIRFLKITIRDLQQSREAWKAKYFTERERADEGGAQREHPPPGNKVKSRRTSSASRSQ